MSISTPAACGRTLMRKLYFGGSFNPIHHAHLLCARAVAEAGGYDRVILVPSAQPPHKPDSGDRAPAADRAQMCRLATRDDPLFEVDELELQRTGPSYTLTTVRALRARGEADIHWLIGADMLAYLPHWHQAETLLTEVHFVIMARPGWSFDFSTLPPPFRPLERNILPAPLVDISATQIRQRVAAQQPIRYLTPDAVVEYIHDRRLYRRRTG
jgi:nicotinate-nucleotide adenylyltransferase